MPTPYHEAGREDYRRNGTTIPRVIVGTAGKSERTRTSSSARLSTMFPFDSKLIISLTMEHYVYFLGR